jgi:hypothetical protein
MIGYRKNGRKAFARLAARRKAWDTVLNSERHAFPDRNGFKRPGSLNRKKSFPAGRGKTHYR